MRKLLEDLYKCLISITSGAGPEAILLRFLRGVIRRLLELLDRGLDLISCCAYLKLILETVILLRYLREKYGNNAEAAFRELQSRSRRGQSFSIRMVTDSKHIAGRVKKEILNTYLDVCQFVHPSSTLVNALLKDQEDYDIVQELVRRVSDYVLYLLLLTFGKNEHICEVCSEYGLQRCSKYCSRG